MSTNPAVDIVKNAILLEHRGRALYKSVVSTSEMEEVREMFALLAEEEEHHIAVLRQQYSRLLKGGDFDASFQDLELSQAADRVLSQDTVAKISGAGYEAAVISAALDFEKKAVAYYSERAKETDSENERAIFTWLAGWEKTHLTMLARLDEELRERIWFDNQFWPLD